MECADRQGLIRRARIWLVVGGCLTLLLLLLACGRTTTWDCGCYRIVGILEQTHVGSASARSVSGRWPKDIGKLRPLASYLIPNTEIARIDGRYYLIDYRRPSAAHQVTADGCYPFIVLYSVRRNGSLPLIWREAYAVRMDGKVVLGSGWNGPLISGTLAIVVLAAMAVWPIFVFRENLFGWLARRRGL